MANATQKRCHTQFDRISNEERITWTPQKCDNTRKYRCGEGINWITSNTFSTKTCLSSATRILHIDLHFHPYKIMICQGMVRADYGRCTNCLSLALKLHTQPFHSLKVTIWCALSSTSIIGSYSFSFCKFNRNYDMLENFLSLTMFSDWMVYM